MVLAQDTTTDIDAVSATTEIDALIALAVIVAGFILGGLLAALVRRIASGESRVEVIQASAGALSTLAFSIVLIVALVTALGLVSPTSLDALSEDVRSFIPRVLSATIVLILANVVAELAATGVERSLTHLPRAIQRRVPLVLKYAILGFAVVIAADQLGVDTTIITIMVASVLFGLALSAALLAGIGGRTVAEQLAAGRALRQQLSVGDSITMGSLNGVVAAIGSTTTQVTTSDRVVLVPNNELLTTELSVAPGDSDDE